MSWGGQNLRSELAGDGRGSKLLHGCLPITSNNEGSLKMVQKLEKLAQELGVERRLQTFASAEVKLDQVELKTLPLRGKRCPSISLLGASVRGG